MEKGTFKKNTKSTKKLSVADKGKAVVSEDAAKVFASEHIRLFGNESQTVGPEDAPKAVHMTMLSE